MRLTFMKAGLLAMLGCGPAVGEEGGTDGGGGSDGSSAPQVLESLEGVLVTDIAVAADGSIAAVGLSGPGEASEEVPVYEQLWVGSFSPEGALRWSAMSPRANETVALESTGVSVGSDGAVFASFVDWGDLEGSASRVMKYDAEGVLLWDAVVGNRPYGVEALGSGGAVTVGATFSTDASNAVRGWAQVIEADGSLAGSGAWVNEVGRNSVLNAAVVLPGDDLILAGGWSVSPLGSESEPWMVWTGTDLLPTADVRIPSSGEAELLVEARALSGGQALVGGPRASGGQVLVVSADGSVVSEETTPEGWRVRDVLSPSAFLATRAVPCEEDAPTCPEEDTLGGWEGGTQTWEKTFEGCSIQDAVGLDPAEAVVAVHCGSATELWRVQ